jgi:hypothetical protein
LLEIAPLLLPALLAYHGRPRSFPTAATRVWPIAAFAVFVVSTTALGATPLHAFHGITIPLSILAIQGVRRAGFRRLPHRLLLGSLAVAAFTIPATWYQLDNARASSRRDQARRISSLRTSTARSITWPTTHSPAA